MKKSIIIMLILLSVITKANDYDINYTNYDFEKYISTGNNLSVSKSTGSLIFTTEDYRISGKNGMDLSIGLIYNSENAKLNSFDFEGVHSMDYDKIGLGWEFNFPHIRKVETPVTKNNNKISWKYRSYTGKIYTLKYVNGDLKIKNEDKQFSDIKMKVTGTGFYNTYRVFSAIITHKNGRKEHFNEYGRVTKIEDKYGNKIKFEYSDKLLKMITDSNGNEIDVKYYNDEKYGDDPEYNGIVFTKNDEELVKYSREIQTYKDYNSIGGVDSNKKIYILEKIEKGSEGTTEFEYETIKPSASIKIGEDIYGESVRMYKHIYAKVLNKITYPTQEVKNIRYYKDHLSKEFLDEDGELIIRIPKFPVKYISNTNSLEEYHKYRYTKKNGGEDYSIIHKMIKNYGNPESYKFDLDNNLILKRILYGKKTDDTFEIEKHANDAIYYLDKWEKEKKISYEDYEKSKPKIIRYTYIDKNNNPRERTEKETFEYNDSGDIKKHMDINENVTNISYKSFKEDDLSYIKSLPEEKTITTKENKKKKVTFEYEVDIGKISKIIRKDYKNELDYKKIEKELYPTGYLEKKILEENGNTAYEMDFGNYPSIDQKIKQNIYYDKQDKLHTRSSDELLGKVQYNTEGNIKYELAGNGYGVSYKYDKYNRVIAQQWPISQKSLDYDFDEQIYYDNLAGENGKIVERIKYSYIPSHNGYKIIRINKDPDFQEKYIYDDEYRLSKACYTKDNGITWNTTRKYEYGLNNKVKSVKIYDDAFSRDTKTYVKYEYEYDELGRLTSKKIDGKEKITKTYNDVENFVKIEEKIDSDNSYEKIIYYDNMGNVIEEREIKSIPSGSKEVSENYNITKYIRDGFGRVTKKIDPKKNETIYKYDRFDRLEKVILPNDLNYTYQYGILDKLTEVNYPNDTVRSLEYDKLGNLIKETDIREKNRYFHYKDNKLKWKKDPEGDIINYTYTTKSALDIISFEDGEDGTVLYDLDYDLYGNLEKETITGNGSIEYKYTPLGEIRKITRKNSEDESKSAEIKFSLGRNISKITDYNGLEYFHKYNDEGQKRSIISSDINYFYDYKNNGLIEKISSSGNGLSMEYEYYPNKKLKKITNKIGWETVKQINEYEYDNNGNTIVDKRSSSAKSSAITKSYEYDDLDRLKSYTGPNGKTKYTYDKMGNILLELNNRSGTINRYDTSGSLLDKQVSIDVNQINDTEIEIDMSTEISDMIYNDNGSMIKKEIGTRVEKFEYNKLNRLSKYTDDRNIITKYGYDSSGNRISKELEYDLIDFYYLNGDLVNEFSDRGDYSYFHDRYGIQAIKNGTQVLNFGKNGVGDIVKIYEDSTIKADSKYSPYGEKEKGYSAVSTPFGYRGYYTDSESELNYLSARYYDPGTRRFLTEDTYKGDPSNPLSLNYYGYVEGNPLKYIDPSGHSTAVAPMGLPIIIDTGITTDYKNNKIIFDTTDSEYKIETFPSMVDNLKDNVRGMASDLKTAKDFIAIFLTLPGALTKNIMESRDKKMKYDPNAEGEHSSFKRDGTTGEIKRYETYKKKSHPKNPNPFEKEKRYDGNGPAHYDKESGKYIETPHVHDFSNDNLRKPKEDEMPSSFKE